ncbi:MULTISPECIES: DUF4405 domain-containing protein [Gordonibacter]|uniref:DUF4405 domain-containing protein n=1 Tax=Gordonibacter faecis TaxID=3047475 RepID=A0ABT7DJH3_9ACTN|nr:MULTISPECIES: DUF4405 domain-containing protein [unclassified Gordonibacter]MDJ1649676.1 DUF4405 domain-containing protein [Gordonibacter sp. KGMB12511]HIW76479.1 DUF4405 domain-containing protein [Candidatus Gordonibacter avicola]
MEKGKNLAIDVVALVVFLVVATPALTGIALHEWLGLALAAVFFVHVVVHVDWIVDTIKGSLAAHSWAHLGNLVLDALILIAFVVCTVSGLLVSGAVLPAFGFFADDYYFWDPLHAISAKALLALLLVHVVVHWRWFASLMGKKKDESHQ